MSHSPHHQPNTTPTQRSPLITTHSKSHTYPSLSIDATQLLHCIIHKTHMTCRSLPGSIASAENEDPLTDETYPVFKRSVRYLLGECDAHGIEIFDSDRYFSEEVIRELWEEMERRRQEHCELNNEEEPLQQPVAFQTKPIEYAMWRLKYAIMCLYPAELHSFARMSLECFPKHRTLRAFGGLDDDSKNKEPVALPSSWKETTMQREWQRRSFRIFLEALQKRIPKGEEGSSRFAMIQSNPFSQQLHEQIYTHGMRRLMERHNDLNMVNDSEWQNVFAQSISMHFEKLRDVNRAVDLVQQYRTSLVRFIKNAFKSNALAPVTPASADSALAVPPTASSEQPLSPYQDSSVSTPLPPTPTSQTKANDAALKEAFLRFSAGDEEIAFEDFRKGLLQFCGVASNDETLLVSRDMFNAMDEDASGTISLNEFRAYMLEETDLTDFKRDIVHQSNGDLEGFFRSLTEQQKERIVYMELLSGLHQIGVSQYPETLLRRFFVTADKGALGEISQQDFVAAFTETKLAMEAEEAKKKAAMQPPPTPAKWTVHRDEYGNRFYFNHQTGKSAWHKPKDLRAPGEKSCSWKEYKNPKGISYFYNKKTKESTWTMPKRLEQYLAHLKRNDFELP